MGNQLKSPLAVAVQMVTPFRKPCDLVSKRVSVPVNLVFFHLFKSFPEPSAVWSASAAKVCA